MERKHMKMAILRQEQTFRQQVHELHRVYRVQKQLMTEMHVAKMNQAHTSTDTETEPLMEMDGPQWYTGSGENKTPTLEEFDLELTLATGAGGRKQKPSNSDSGATASSSTSVESETGRRLAESNVNLGFQSDSNMHDDQLMQSPWLYQCLSLNMA